MEVKDIENIITQVLKPMNFKKKRRTWTMKGKEITEVVTLQKSYYGNFCYLDHNYIVNAIPLGGMRVHTATCWYMEDAYEFMHLKTLLDLENDMPDEERCNQLHEYLSHRFGKYVGVIDTEEKFKEIMRNRLVSREAQKYFKIGVYAERE